MNPCTQALRLLEQEVLGIRARLDAQLPYALQMPMVPAANISDEAMSAIERHMQAARQQLRVRIARFLHQLRQLRATPHNTALAQRRYALLKLYFHAALTHFEIFAEVLTQRSQHGTGIWLAGLDVAAQDGLKQAGVTPTTPPVICYVERGHGGAIRRARTRLPGGGANPVAVIRIPRERMVGTGIAASLYHEVGHQAAALLDLVNAYRRAAVAHVTHGPAWWRAWDRWISEILADLWAVSRVGIAATCGLMSVVSLPRAFVLRVNLDDPHPAPWIRVKLSVAMGRALYPHPQWNELEQVWERLYPREQMSESQRNTFDVLDRAVPVFVESLLALRAPALRGRSLGDTLRLPDRHPQRLLGLWQQVKLRPQQLLANTPALAFAVLGQARYSGLLPAGDELRIIAALLQRWALAGYLPWKADSMQLSVVLNQRRPTPLSMAAHS
ncbi:hypothetical protein [Paraburkholderia humisilvae]|uniref:Uncharacterized protein n=1 Tax=Paraburkholderia humisilvae TaxID=627669 RepID=A0A6J5D066_9BURK|nr:hypothetical protein [Paraburkholderia humisilvae]CAB3746066.1 hypothetical protein LMG29542_00114 [Paraburkholderia humisilvae]